MSRKLVRTNRQHLTSEGMRYPGEEYERDGVEAATLEAQGLLTIVGEVAEPPPPPAPAVTKTGGRKPAAPAGR